MKRTPSRAAENLVWLLGASAAILVGLLTPWLNPHLVPDSLSYLEYPLTEFDEALRSQRTPGYPIFLALCQAMLGDLRYVPLCQLLLFMVAARALWGELAQWAMPPLPRWTIALAILFGCTAIDQITTVATDAPAAAWGVLTASALLRWSRPSSGIVSWLAVIGCTAVAYSMRPAYLFLIPWVGVAGFLLQHVGRASTRKGMLASLSLMFLTGMPLLGWMTLRKAVVDDFGVVPFGGQNLAGVLVQLVSPEELQSLPEPSSGLAKEINAARVRWMEQGPWKPDDNPRAYMTWENRWDDATWRIVVPALQKHVGNDSIAAHRAISQLNRQVLMQYPQRYLIWGLKAIRRAAWVIVADVTMHPAFLLFGIIVIGCVLWRCSFGPALPPIVFPPGIEPLAVVAFTYAAFKVGFVILTSPPIGRFADAAGIFLPASLAGILIHWLSTWSCSISTANSSTIRR